MNHKIKESIAAFSVIALLAFVAGAENYYSEIQGEFYSAPEGQHTHLQPTTILQKTKMSLNQDSAGTKSKLSMRRWSSTR